MNYLKRKKEFLKAVEKLKSNAVLISNPINVEYLTGFKSSNAFVLLTQNETTIFTDFRYKLLAEEIAKKENINAIIIKKGLTSTLRKYLYKNNLKKVAFEDNHLTVSKFQILEKSIRKVNWKPIKANLLYVRDKKSNEEINLMAIAIEVAEKGLASIKQKEWIGLKEFEAAELLEARMKLAAKKFNLKTDPAFKIIVATGANSALPHHSPGNDIIKENQILLVDWGAKIESYCSDMTRTFFLGKPDKKFEKIYNIVLKANNAAIKAAKAGVPMSKIDKAARKIIKNAGFEKEFGHGTGHGIGLEVHEGSGPAASSKTNAKAGTVITIEPGIYLPKWGGIRIEDMILITSKEAKVLTSLPK